MALLNMIMICLLVVFECFLMVLRVVSGQEELLKAYAENQLESVATKWSHRFDAKLIEVLEDEQRLATDECSRPRKTY